MEIGVGEAAARLGVSQQRVRAMIYADQIASRRIAGRLVVEEADLRRSAARSRPMSQRMAWALIDLLSDRPAANVSAAEAVRLREKYQRLLQSGEPAALLRSWLARRAARRAFSVAVDDLPQLAADARFTVSGISDSRSGMSSAAELEGYVAPQNLDGLVGDFLLSGLGRPNLFLHLRFLPDRPVPLGVVLADLAEHDRPREDGRIAELVQENLR